MKHWAECASQLQHNAVMPAFVLTEHFLAGHKQASMQACFQVMLSLLCCDQSLIVTDVAATQNPGLHQLPAALPAWSCHAKLHAYGFHECNNYPGNGSLCCAAAASARCHPVEPRHLQQDTAEPVVGLWLQSCGNPPSSRCSPSLHGHCPHSFHLRLAGSIITYPICP